MRGWLRTIVTIVGFIEFHSRHCEEDSGSSEGQRFDNWFMRRIDDVRHRKNSYEDGANRCSGQ